MVCLKSSYSFFANPGSRGQLLLGDSEQISGSGNLST
jgi:hypothetical protein